MINPLIMFYLIALFSCLRGMFFTVGTWNLERQADYNRETARGGGTANTASEKNIPELEGSNKRKKLLVQNRSFSFHHVLFPRTVPSYRSQRRGPDCTRLCSSAPWKHGWSRSWSEGSLAPAEMKDLFYYYKKPADATSYSKDGI